MGDFLEKYKKFLEEGSTGSLSGATSVEKQTSSGSSLFENTSYSDPREQAIIDSRERDREGSFLDKYSLFLKKREVEARRQQRAYAEQASPEMVNIAKDLQMNVGDRNKRLEIIRKLKPEQLEEVLRVSAGISQQMGDDRGGFLNRALGAVSRGISQGVSQPIMELTGFGGTPEEIEYIRKLDAMAAQEFDPSRPSDPWYERGPLQAAQMAPWMATVVGGNVAGTAAGKIGGQLLARGAAAGVPGAKTAFQTAGAIGRTPSAIGMQGATTRSVFEGAGGLAGVTAASFPGQYAQEVDSLKELGMEDDWKLRLLAGGTATIGGLVEGIVPNPFAGGVSLKNGAMNAARQYLWEAAKKAPGELSEEYLQGVTSGLGQYIAQYVDENAKDKTITDAFVNGWEQAKEAALPMAFLLGTPAVGGAGLSAIRARKYQLEQIKAKNFVSESDAKEAGIEGASRRERMANVDAEIEQLTAAESDAIAQSDQEFIQQQQAGQVPPMQGGDQVDEAGGLIPQVSQDDLDREFAARMAAQGGNVATPVATGTETTPPVASQPTVQPPQVPPVAQQPQPLYEVTGDENMVARVWTNPNGFLVNLTDMDSGEVDTRAMIFPTFEQARQHADTVRLPVQQPQVQPSVTSEDPFAEQQPSPLTDPFDGQQQSPQQPAVVTPAAQQPAPALTPEQQVEADDQLDSRPDSDTETAFQVPVVTSLDDHAKIPMFGVYERIFNGEKKYAVKQYEKGGFGDSLFGSAQEARVESDRMFAISEEKKRSEEESRKQSEETSRKQSEYEASFGGFLSSDPKSKGRQLKVLGSSRQYNGKVVTVKDLIEQKIAGGAVVNASGQLESPDGAYLGSDKITKIGIDYARHLLANKSQPPTEESPALSIDEVFDELKKYPEKVAGMSDEEIKAELEKLKSEPKPNAIPQTAAEFEQELTSRVVSRVQSMYDTGNWSELGFMDYLQTETDKAFGDLIVEVVESDQLEGEVRDFINSFKAPEFAKTVRSKLDEGKQIQAEKPVRKTPESETQPAPQGKTEGFRSLPEKSRSKFEELWNADDTSIKDILDKTNKNLRAEFEARTGLTLPKTKKGTEETVEKWHAEGRKLADETQPEVSGNKPKPPAGYKPLAEFTPMVTQTLSPDLELEENRNGIKELALKQGEAVGYRVYPKRGSIKGGYWQYGTVRYEPSGSHASIELADGTIESVGGSRLVRLEPFTATPEVEQDLTEGQKIALSALDAMLASEKPKEPPKPRSVRKEPEKTKQGQYVLPIMPGMAAEIDRQDFVRRYRDQALEPLWGWSNKEEDAEGIQMTIDTLAPIYSEIFNDIYAGKRETIDDVFDSEPYERILKLDDDAIAVGDELIINRLDEQIKAALQDYQKKAAKKPTRKSEQTLEEAKSDMQAAHDAAASVMEKIRNKLMSGIDPEISAEVVRVAYLYTKAGIKTFKGYVETIVEHFGEAFAREFGPYMQDGWTALNIRGLVGEPAGKVEDYLGKENADEGVDTTRPDDTGDMAKDETKPSKKPRKRRGSGKSSSGGKRGDAKSGRDDETTGDGSDADTGGNREGISSPAGSLNNHRIGDRPSWLEGGAVTKLNRNIESIETMQVVEREGRRATPEEQLFIAQYTGWGHLKQFFIRDSDIFSLKAIEGKEWRKEAFDRLDQITEQRIREQGGRKGRTESQMLAKIQREQATNKHRIRLALSMTPAEYAQARKSTRYSHYTDPAVARSMWNFLEKSLPEAGKIRVLEPSEGSGMFWGTMPDSMFKRAEMHGIDMDTASSRVAKHLYPSVRHLNIPYQQAPYPEGFFDVAITNVPFNKNPVVDAIEGIEDLSLHNYYFAKTAKRVREGGVVAFITTHFTMDATAPKQREAISAQGLKFLGAVRLHQDAFGGIANTKVVTDIIIMQKVAPGQPGMDSNNGFNAPAQTESVPYYGDPVGGARVFMHPYFVERQNMIAGTTTANGEMRGEGPELTVESEMTTEETAAFIDSALAKIDVDKDAFVAGESQRKDMTEESEGSSTFVPEHLKELEIGRLEVDGNRLVLRTSEDTMVVVKSKFSPAMQARAKKWFAIRDAMISLRVLQRRDDNPVAQIEIAREKLNEVYDDFVGKFNANAGEAGEYEGYKPLNTPYNKSMFSSDFMSASVLALENTRLEPTGELDKNGNEKKVLRVEKAGVFRERNEWPLKHRPKPKTVLEALARSLFVRGGVDVEFIAESLGKQKADILSELEDYAFALPNNGGWEIKEVYLSGNIAQKLAIAEKAAEQDVSFTRNVNALKEVLPVRKSFDQLSIQINSPFMPADVLQGFVAKELGLGNFDVRKNNQELGGGWIAVYDKRDESNQTTQDRDQYAVRSGNRIRRTGFDLFVDMMAGKPTIIVDEDENGRMIPNAALINLAKTKRADLLRAFDVYVRENQDRMDYIAKAFNDSIGGYVKQNIPDWVVSLDGMADVWKDLTRSYQKTAIGKIALGGNTLLAHRVGYGKTLSGVAGVMEQIRLGVARKPIVVVPNHLTGQWAKSFADYYPSALVMAPLSTDFEKSKRQATMNRIMTGNWDAVIIPESSFKKLPMSPEYVQEFFQAQIAQAIAVIEQARADSGSDPRTIAELENIKERLENNMAKYLAESQKDPGPFFDEMGIDSLMVDEAHHYKNLPFYTQNTRIAGINPTGSQQAFDMLMKTDFINNLTGSRNVTFLTGTPIANSMTEAWVMMRYLMPEEMKNAGVFAFDDWKTTFGAVVDRTRVNTIGTGFRTESRFQEFVNIESLSKMFQQVADIQMKSNDVEVPPVSGGKPKTIVVPASDAMKNFMLGLAARGQSMPEDPSIDNMLNVMTVGAGAAIDFRLLNPSAIPAETSKLNVAADEVSRVYDMTTAFKGTQIIWSDRGVPKSAKKLTPEMKELGAWMLQQVELRPLTMEEVKDKWKELRPTKGAADELRRFMGMAIQDMNVTEATDEDPDAYRVDIPDEPSVYIKDITGIDPNITEQAAPPWNVYQEMKSLLIARGVPADQIVFIHDYKTAAQKIELFRKMNAGDIRILIGNTPRLGTGANIQERLVAAHHLDVPWRPADVEQRDGRIIRSGNRVFAWGGNKGYAELAGVLLDGVMINRYVTEGSIDARYWDTNEMKAQMLQDFWSDSPGVSMEELGATTLSMAEVKAAAVANPLLREKIELETRLGKLEEEYRGALQSNAQTRYRLEEATSSVRQSKVALEEAKAHVAWFDEGKKTLPKGESFAIVIDGKTLYRRDDIAEALEAKLHEIGKNIATLELEKDPSSWAKKNRTNNVNVVLGTVFGKPVVASVDAGFRNRETGEFLVANSHQESQIRKGLESGKWEKSYHDAVFRIGDLGGLRNLGNNPQGFLARIRNHAEPAEDLIRSHEKALKSNEKTLADLEKLVESLSKPDNSEILKVQAKLESVSNEIGDEGDDQITFWVATEELEKTLGTDALQDQLGRVDSTETLLGYINHPEHGLLSVFNRAGDTRPPAYNMVWLEGKKTTIGYVLRDDKGVMGLPILKAPQGIGVLKHPEYGELIVYDRKEGDVPQRGKVWVESADGKTNFGYQEKDKDVVMGVEMVRVSSTGGYPEGLKTSTELREAKLKTGSDLDKGLRNPPDVLFQTEPDIDATIRSEALDLGIAANKQGITQFEDFIAYSVRTIGESQTRLIGNYLTMVGKTVGMQGVRPTKDVLGVPMTQEQYTQLAKETFTSVPAEQVEAGIEAAMVTGLPQTAVGFAPPGSPVPGQGLMQETGVRRIDMNYKDVTRRVPQLTEAAKQLKEGKITKDEYANIVDRYKEVTPYSFVPEPATTEDAKRALSESKFEAYGDAATSIPDGYVVELRLDIPAYKDHGVWINSIHRKVNGKSVTQYDSYSYVTGADFIQSQSKQEMALEVATGAQTKSPFARIKGKWKPTTKEQAVAIARDALQSSEWTQVGYDPERHGYFYDRSNHRLVLESADEAIQIGPLVLAKNPVYASQGDVLFQSQESAPRWYLKSRKLIADKMGSKATSEQVVGMLRKNGVNDEELYWSGLEELLGNKQLVTKEEVLAAIDSGFQLLESQYPSEPQDVTEARKRLESQGITLEEGMDGEFAWQDENGVLEDDDIESLPLAQQADILAVMYSGMDTVGAKYSDYATTDNENYKELLIRLPLVKKLGYQGGAKYRIGKPSDGKFYVVRNGTWEDEAYNTEAEAQAVIDAIPKEKVVDTGAIYESSHWDEYNVLAHLRMTEMDDANGKKVLLIEEIQSDWHQEGRLKGYRSANRYSKMTKAELAVAYKRDVGYDPFEDSPGIDVEEVRQTLQGRNRIDEEQRVPDAPFKKSWPMLAMKRAIQYAIEVGADRVAWVGGQQQADRYGLSATIEKIEYSGTDLAVYYKGDFGNVNITSITPDMLSAHIGQEAAQMLMAKDPANGVRSLEGLELKRGGEGLIAFYDQILPNETNKLIKKFGSRVFDAQLPSHVKTGRDLPAGAVETDEDRRIHQFDITPAMRDSALQYGQPLFQRQSQGGNVKGWTKFISGTRALIGATNKADISTVIHEFAHPIRRFLLDRNIPQEQRVDITDEEIEMLEKKCGAGSMVDGEWVTKWDVPAEEKFARMWEQYWFDGKSPNKVLDSLFAKISRWMREVYNSITQITGSPLDPKVVELFDKLVQRGLTEEQRGDTRSPTDGGGSSTAKPSDMNEWSERVTSIKNQVAEMIRLRVGLPGFTEPSRETFQQWLDEASQLLKADPALGYRLIKELSQSNRTIDHIEVAVLQMQFQHLNNQLDAASERLFAANEAKDSVAAAQARLDSDMLINQIEDFTDITKRAGTDAGRALVARRIALLSDFSLAALLRKARVANGGEQLNEEQQRQIEDLSRKIEKLEGDLEKEIQKNNDLERQAAIKQGIDDDKKQAGKPVKNTARKRASDTVKEFAKKFSNIFGGSGGTETLQQTEDEKMAEAAVDVIKSYVASGVYSFGEFMAKVKQDLGAEVPVAAKVAFRTAWEELKSQGDIPTPEVSEDQRAKEIGRLAKMIQYALVESGITDPEDVIDGVHESLQEVFEEITRRETMDAMSGYGQYSTPSQDPTDKIVRDLNAQYQQMAKLDDMQQGIAPKRSGRGRDEPTDELRKLIREVNEMKRKSKYFVTDPELQLKTIFQATRTSLRNRIYDLDQAINVTGKPIPGRTPNTFEGKQAEEIDKLRKKRDELLAEYKATFPKPGMTFEQRAAIVERALERQILEVEKQLASGNVAPKPSVTPISTPSIDAKRARLDALRAQREAVREMQTTDEERDEKRNRQAEKAYIANLLNRIADYEDRRRQGYFGPKPKKKPRELSPREIELSRQLVNLKDEFFRYSAEYRLKNMGRVERAWDNTKETMNLSRAIMTSFDVSAVFRQGGIASLAHPRLAGAASLEMWNALRSQDAEFKTMEDIEKDDLYAFAMQCGLPITTDKGKIQRQEEAYAGRMVKYGIGKKGTKLNTWSKWALRPVTASGRAYTTFLNSMRFRLFKYMVSNLGAGGEVTLDEGKVIASYISAATGRADLGKFNQAAANLNMVFFAPRYVASRFQYLAMPFYLLPSSKVSGRVKKMIAMEYARHIMGLTAFLGLSVALGSLLTDDEEEKPTVEFDPRSSDWMKLKIGDTRIDPMAGLSQTVTLVGQLATGQKKGLKGDIQDLYGEKRKFGDPDLWDVTTGFLRKKLAPIPGAIVDLRVGENVIGEKETVLSATKDLFIPLSFQEAGETFKARGIVGGAAVTALSLLGMGGGTYGPKTEYATADAAKREELLTKELDRMKWDSPDPAFKDFLTPSQLDQFTKKREQRKQALAYAASADPKRKTHSSDEAYKQSVAEQEEAMSSLIKSGMGFEEIRQLLIAYYKRNYGSAYETRNGTYGMKESLTNRLRVIRRKMTKDKS